MVLLFILRTKAGDLALNGVPLQLRVLRGSHGDGVGEPFWLCHYLQAGGDEVIKGSTTTIRPGLNQDPFGPRSSCDVPQGQQPR